MLTVKPGEDFNAAVSTAVTGQTGTLAVQVVLPGEQQVAIPRTTAGIVEFPAGSGNYGVELVAPVNPGEYLIVWDWAGSGAITPANSHVEQLLINVWTPTDAQSNVLWPWLGGFEDWNPGEDVSEGAPGSSPIPTAADVRAVSNLPWADYGPLLAKDTGPGGLQVIVDRAESAFFNITGQSLGSIDSKFAPQVRRVIQAMVEGLAMQGSSDTIDTLSDWDLIVSFSAGPYSETRRTPADMFAGRMLWPVPWISMALWALLTDERFSFWLAFFTGVQQPAWMASDVFWEEGQAWSRIDGPSPGYWGGA